MIQVQPIYDPLYTNKDKFIILLTGGRGSGKSFNASTFIERLSFEVGHKILYARYTMVSAAISVIPEFTEKIDLDKTGRHFDVTAKGILNKRSGTEIMFRGIKTSSGNQTAKLKSIQGLTTFVGDEMEEWESEEDYDKLMLSIRQKGIQNRIVLILNPTSSDHWIYQKYIENTHVVKKIDGVDVQMSTHPDVLHIHTTYFDNIKNLGDQFIREVGRIKEKCLADCTLLGKLDQAAFNKTKYATKIIARWSDIAEDAIFENWEEGAFDNTLPYCYGQDYGYSVDPDTLIKVAINHKKKLIYLHELYYNRGQLGTDDLYKLNASLIAKKTDLIVADSAEPRLIADLEEKGLNIIGANKKEVAADITAMIDYTIIVTPDSHNAKKELRNYKWNNKKAGIPIDRFNHILDPTRYCFNELNVGFENDLSILSIFG
jgi:phage terminase large subunit